MNEEDNDNLNEEDALNEEDYDNSSENKEDNKNNTDTSLEVFLTSNSNSFFFENMELSDDTENILSNDNICEETNSIKFPNKAYVDLMTLVTNYNLSNKAANTIIHLFNEHSNLLLSPLLKNIKKGRELMEKMKIPTLLSKKHKILTYNNIDYYLFYHPILNCIKNILSIPDILENFALNFKNFKIN